jgi:hypothetical protein
LGFDCFRLWVLVCFHQPEEKDLKVTERQATWDFLKDFRWIPRPAPTPCWAATVAMCGPLRAELKTTCAGLGDALAASDGRLKDLGGDPCRAAWSTFRPLRLSREEDWSDWLAHLLETSTTGVLGARIFGGDRGLFRGIRALEREWCLPGGYRADIALGLSDESWIHLEVKVGDQAFAKTAATGDAMQRAIGADATVRNYILLPECDLSEWNLLARADTTGSGNAKVAAITWTEAGLAIRSALLVDEPVSWKVWALTFVGALEQQILGFPQIVGPVNVAERGIHSLKKHAEFTEYLNRGGTSGY